MMASRCFNSKVYNTNINGGKSSTSSLDNSLNIKNMIKGLVITLFVLAYMVWG